MAFLHNSSRIWIWASILCIVIVGVTALFTQGAPFVWLRSWARASFSLATGPLISVFPSFRGGDSENVMTIDQCTAENKRFAIEVSSLIQLKAENETLRQVLDFRKQSSQRHVLATIVSRHDKEGVSAVTIDRGRSDGIEEGHAVVDARGVLIGVIIEVSTSTATVLDIKDGGSVISATLAEYDTPLGIVKGKKGATLSFELIPKESSIKKDDSVITAGVETHIPYGILIGRIERNEPDVNGLFKKALVSPEGSLDAERFVMVFIP